MNLFSLESIIIIVLMTILCHVLNHRRKWIVLIANIVFLLFGGLYGFFIMNVYILLTWLLLQIGEMPKKMRFVCAIIEILPLLFLKYISTWVGLDVSIFVPIGLSFFSLESVGILIEKNQKKAAAPRFFDYYVFLSFLPTITSGPICRYDVLEQISGNDGITPKSISDGFECIVTGFFLKILIAERMGQIVSGTYGNLYEVSGVNLLLASICFTIQIYCDFCGYSMIAVGIAKMVGIEIPRNFDSPYSACSITDFWRRWHISLSTWFRDYIYIPLGGNKKGKKRQYVNLIITFLLSGIWHGASLTYALWGLVHGVALCLEKALGVMGNYDGKISRVTKRIFILLYINFTWIIFRSSSVSDVIFIVKKIVLDVIPSGLGLCSLSGMLECVYSIGMTVPNFLGCVIAGVLFACWEAGHRRYESSKREIKFIVMIMLLFFTLIFGITGKSGEFIYAKY